MKIAVSANDSQWKEFINATRVDCLRFDSLKNIPDDIEALFVLNYQGQYDLNSTIRPVIINAVATTLEDINASGHVMRFNGWNGFLARSTWEVAGNIHNDVMKIFSALGKQLVEVPDEPGFVSARVISMIINEAYFAVEDKISTKEAIDIAMKLGTGYPYGPFEWAASIGLPEILALLNRLSLGDNRYLPSMLLKAEASV